MTDNDRKRLGMLIRRIMLAGGIPGLLQFIDSLTPMTSMSVMEEYGRTYCDEQCQAVRCRRLRN